MTRTHPHLPRRASGQPGWALPLCALAGACSVATGVQGQGSFNDKGGDTASQQDSADTSSFDTSDDVTDDTATDTGDGVTEIPSWCLDWEGGDLAGAGYTGAFVELGDGAILLNAAEGDDFSALTGEERVQFKGDRALIMRSSHTGDTDSISIATTPGFEVTDTELWWWQLSEVDEIGVEFYADLLDNNGAVLASIDLPVETGGHLPGLQEHHEPIDAYPDIVYGEGEPGTLTRQLVPMGDYLGQVVRLRLYQHTRIENNGFFTIVDEICHGETDAHTELEWGEADPTH